MKQDPFENLADWGSALNTIEEMAAAGRLSSCQPGLIRILRYKGNWRLREAVLRHVGEIQTPSEELVQQVLTILDDDNIYYDARMLAGDALSQLLNNMGGEGGRAIHRKARDVLTRLRSTPQPPFFDKALNATCSAVGIN